MMNKRDEDELRNYVRKFIEALSDKGISSEKVGVFKIGDESRFDPKKNKEEDNLNQAIGDSLKRVFGKKNVEEIKLDKEEEREEKDEDYEDDDKQEFCSCPNCFTFKNFEEEINKFYDDGKFDYATLVLNGKKFNVKYWSNKEREQLMIDKELEELISDLERELVEALAKKDYKTALEITLKLNNQNK